MKMSIYTFFVLVMIGIAAGVLGGMFGLGGGIIMIPALVYLLGMSQHGAQGTSVAIMLPPIGIMAAYNYYKAGEINIKYALIIAAAFIIGGYFGSQLALQLSTNVLKKVFAVVMIIFAVRMFFSKGP
jgi:uncharacterized membrane protein YfcA